MRSKVAENLIAAAEVIERQGWTTDTPGMWVGDGPKCALGAISQVREVETRLSEIGLPRLAYSYTYAEDTSEARALAEWLDVRVEDIPLWNDGGRQTAERVTGAMRNCAAQLEMEATPFEESSPWAGVVE